MIGFPNNIDSATLSGGSFTAGLPLANLQTRKLKEVARTTNAAKANTYVQIALPKPRASRILSLVNHNFSTAARYRVRGSNAGPIGDADVCPYDSNWLDVWPIVYPYGTKEWEDPNWWGGRYSTEELSGYSATLVHLFSKAMLYQYWRIDIDDTANPIGYLQWGRMFIGPAWQPAINMSWGASIAWETDTDVQKSLGGAESYDVRSPYRVQRYKLDAMTRDEAMSNAFEIQRRAGIDKEVLWVSDPDDTVHALRTRFLARIRSLSPIEYPYFNNNTTAFELKELQ